MADRAALLIAVETFFEAGPVVQYAAADCAELMRALPAAGYAQDKCTLLAAHRTTKAVIEATLKRLPKLLGDAGSLLVLVVSRGFNVKGRGYIACADTIAPDPLETALPVADLFAALGKLKAKEITVLLDLDPLILGDGKLMHPGPDAAELESILEKSPKCAALVSCSEGERSFESGQLRHGIWRHHLIEAFTGKARAGATKDGSLSAAELHEFLADAVPRTLRRTYETQQEQTPALYGEANAGAVVADLSRLLGPGSDLLDPTRMKRVVFRTESRADVKNLSGYRKGQPVPDRANEWARKHVNRIAAQDIKLDLDSTFDMVRETFGYKRKSLDVSAERDGLGYIRTPDFEYTVTVSVSQEDPSEVIWRREVSRLSGPEFVRGEPFRDVFGTMFDRLVFEFAQPVDVADFVDRIEDAPPEGVMVSVASDSGAAVVALAGFSGRISVTRDALTIEGRAGNPSSLMEQFLVFIRKFGALGEPRAITAGG